MFWIRLFWVALILALSVGVAQANKITDCKAVDEKATASVASGLTTQLSTSGKTCTFTVDGSSSTSVSPASEANYRANLPSFARVVVFGDQVSPELLSQMLFSPFFSDNVPQELVAALTTAAQTFTDCLASGALDGLEFSVDVSSGVPAGCGVINPTDTPIDISLPTSPGSVTVRTSEAILVLSIDVSGIAFYAIFPADRLRFEANR